MRLLGAAALLLSLLAPAALAAAPAAPMPTLVDAACLATASARATPPCGYIQAYMEIQIDGKKPCKKADRSDCEPIMEKTAKKEYTGTFTYWWKVSEDLTYPETDPNAPVVVTFVGVGSNPKWLSFKVEPATFTIANTDLADPTNYKLDTSGSSPVLYFWYTKPITLTVTHSGDPTQAELDKLATKNEVAQLMIKAKGTASGAYYKESYATTTMRWDASSLLATAPDGEVATGPDGHALPAGSEPPPAAKASPASGLIGVLGSLGLVALLRRRAA